MHVCMCVGMYAAVCRRALMRLCVDKKNLRCGTTPVKQQIHTHTHTPNAVRDSEGKMFPTSPIALYIPLELLRFNELMTLENLPVSFKLDDEMP